MKRVELLKIEEKFIQEKETFLKHLGQIREALAAECDEISSELGRVKDKSKKLAALKINLDSKLGTLDKTEDQLRADKDSKEKQMKDLMILKAKIPKKINELRNNKNKLAKDLADTKNQRIDTLTRTKKAGSLIAKVNLLVRTRQNEFEISSKNLTELEKKLKLLEAGEIVWEKPEHKAKKMGLIKSFRKHFGAKAPQKKKAPVQKQAPAKAAPKRTKPKRSSPKKSTRKKPTAKPKNLMDDVDSFLGS